MGYAPFLFQNVPRNDGRSGYYCRIELDLQPPFRLAHILVDRETSTRSRRMDGHCIESSIPKHIQNCVIRRWDGGALIDLYSFCCG